jgi:type II secretion system protein G
LSTRAFTLIELLIVVAIISILSAIAVPNFLEAQARSKVARVDNDLRTIATALELYRVDNNAYPKAELYDSLVRRTRALTTPIAYITDLPEDPFFQLQNSVFGGDTPQYAYAPGNIYFGLSSQYNIAEYRNQIYSLAGRGPDANIFVGGYCMAHPLADVNGARTQGTYDPTNGTISSGDILRLSPGKF